MSLYLRARVFFEQNRAAVSRALLAIVLAAVIVGWQVDQVKNVLVDSGLLLVLLLGLVLELSVSLSRLVSVRPRVDVARNEDENLDLLKTYCAKRRPQQVDLLEHSAVSVHRLIEDLAQHGASLRVLIKHPDSVGPFQRRRILASIAHLERFVLRQHGARVAIRCYQAASSLRGRKLDNLLVNVGWYTPDIDSEGVGGYGEIIGHLNPVVMCSAATEEGQHLREMFDRVFESLWLSAEGSDALTVARLHDDGA